MERVRVISDKCAQLNWLCPSPHLTIFCSSFFFLALRGEVSAECGDDGAQYEQTLEKLRQDMETNSKSVCPPSPSRF